MDKIPCSCKAMDLLTGGGVVPRGGGGVKVDKIPCSCIVMDFLTGGGVVLGGGGGVNAGPGLSTRGIVNRCLW